MLIIGEENKIRLILKIGKPENDALGMDSYSSSIILLSTKTHNNATSIESSF